jgi:hypothetical protein
MSKKVLRIITLSMSVGCGLSGSVLVLFPHARNPLIRFDVSGAHTILGITRKSFPSAGFLLFRKEFSLSLE